MTKILILQQIHGSNQINNHLLKANTENDLDNDPREKFNSIAESHYEIARYLIAHPDIPVVFENNSPESIAPTGEKMLKEILDRLFPDGHLPQKYEALTFEQKRLLVLMNGYKFSLFTGQTRYGYYDHPANLHLSSQIKPIETIKTSQGLITREKIDQSREYNVLAYAKDLATKTKNNSVIVIYGAGHRFTDVATCLPDLTLEIINFKLTHEEQKDHPFTIAIEESKKLTDMYRPSVNCQRLDTQYRFPQQKSLIDRPQVDVSRNRSNPIYSMTAAAGGSLLLAGVMLFGIFKCCKKLSKNNTKESAFSTKLKSQ